MIGIGALNSGIGNLGFDGSGSNSIGLFQLRQRATSWLLRKQADGSFGFFNSGDTNTGLGAAGFTSSASGTRAAAASVSGNAGLLSFRFGNWVETWVSATQFNTGSFNSGTLRYRRLELGRLQPTQLGRSSTGGFLRRPEHRVSAARWTNR